MRALAFLALLLATSAWGQGCKVLDPELQESYSGPCVNGMAEGEGSARGTAEYQGFFKAGRKHGKGVKTWKNGDRYEGDFVEDRREGQGVYAWGDGQWKGERYEGAYVNDKRHGQGTYRWPSGDVYKGPWEDDRPTGPGTEMMHARAKWAEEARLAVAKKGQKVCREMPVGIGGRDWARGEVVDIEGDHVGVRIDDPGVHAHFPKGEVVWDLAWTWTPCWQGP